MDNLLEPILTFNMSEREAKAYKITLLWDALCRKEFPNYKHDKVKRSGDPRKSLIFKYAYKLINETEGILQDKEYRLYLTAQLHILKQCTDGNVHALLGPQCFVGDKAWKRWRIWKDKYDKYMAKKSVRVGNIPITLPIKIKSELEQTKLFLVGFFGKYPTLDDIRQSISNKNLVKWVTLGRVSPYYALESPFVKQALGDQDIEKMFSFDIGVFRVHLNEEIRGYLMSIFSPEYEVK